MSDLGERLECAQENLSSKSNELQELQQISETQQERIFELETELANYRTGTVDHGKQRSASKPNDFIVHFGLAQRITAIHRLCKFFFEKVKKETRCSPKLTISAKRCAMI